VHSTERISYADEATKERPNSGICHHCIEILFSLSFCYFQDGSERLQQLCSDVCQVRSEIIITFGLFPNIYKQDDDGYDYLSTYNPAEADKKLSTEAYGYSDNGSLCLKLCRSEELPDLSAPAFSKAQSAQAVEEIIREKGLLELWRDMNATATIYCEGDGNNLNYYILLRLCYTYIYFPS